VIGMRFLVDEGTLHLQGKRLVSVGSGENLDGFARHFIKEGLVLPNTEVRKGLASRPHVGTAQQAELERRFTTLDHDRTQSVTWETLKAELEQRCA